MVNQVHFALPISRQMVPMAAKQGAHSRLKAQKARMAGTDPANKAANAAHMAGSVSPTSPRLVRMPTVATTFSFATRPVTDVTVACQSPKPSGAKIQPIALPKPAKRLYWM